jgi:hypothetical protein
MDFDGDDDDEYDNFSYDSEATESVTSVWSADDHRDDYLGSFSSNVQVGKVWVPMERIENLEDDNDDDDDNRVYTCQTLKVTRNFDDELSAREKSLLIRTFKKRPDIQKLMITLCPCCPGPHHSQLALDIVQADRREWLSITVDGYSKAQFVTDLLDRLDQVQSLNFGECNLDFGALEKQIPLLADLDTLRIEYHSWSSLDLKSLVCSVAKNGTLRRLSLSRGHFECCHGNRFVETLLFRLGDIPHLTTLNLSHCGLTDQEMCYLMTVVRSHPSLQHLHVGGNTCHSDESVLAVASLLRRKRSKLVDLNLSDVWTCPNPNCKVDLSPLFAALESNKTLKKLNLRRIRPAVDEIRSLGQMLRTNTTLQLLDVRHSECFSLAVHEELFDGAKTNRTLQGLRLTIGYRLLLAFPSPFDIHRHSHRYQLLYDRSEFYTHLNWAGRGVLNQDIPIALWPFIFARLNNHVVDERFHSDHHKPAVLYHLLRCPDGETENLPLAVSIAMNHSHRQALTTSPGTSDRLIRATRARAASRQQQQQQQPCQKRPRRISI